MRKSGPANDVWIMGGDVRLQQIFVNLLNNAIDALEGAKRKEIDIAIKDRERDILVTVRDWGPGVPEKDLQNIFDPFFTSKEVGKGMGLGLSITYGLVKQFGGTIHAANERGGGALFILSFVPAREKRDRAA